jgi:hypothetical protein
LFRDLSNNGLTNIKERTFSENIKLETLNLDNNAMTGLPGKIFATNKNLLELTIKNNKLSNHPTFGLDSSAFEGLDSLTHLYLNGNLLTTIDAAIFTHLGKLKELYVNENPLEAISDHAFSAQNQSLQVVELKGNRLVSLSESIFGTIEPLAHLYLSGIDWNCCEVKWMYHRKDYITDISSVLCDQPETPRQHQWNMGDELTFDAVNDMSANSECLVKTPDAPTEADITGLTSTSATASWSPVKGNAFKVDYFFVIYKDLTAKGRLLVAQCAAGEYPPPLDAPLDDMGDCKVLTGNSNFATYSLPINGLNKFTEYEIYLIAHSKLPGTAEDGGTWSEAGMRQTFKTLADTPEAVESATATAQSAYTILLEWEPPSVPNGKIEKYIIIVDGFDAPISKPATEGTSYTVNGLAAFTSYTITIRAVTSQGEGLAIQVEQKTFEAAPGSLQAPLLQTETGSPPRLPDGTRAVEASSIAIQWSSVSEEEANGRVTGYTVYANEKTEIVGVAGLGFLSGASITKTIVTGLSASSSYEFKVTASTEGGGESAKSAGLGVFTAQAAPEVMNAPTARGKSASEMIVMWEPPIVSNGPIKGYNLLYYPCVRELAQKYRSKCQLLYPEDDLRSEINSTWPLQINTSSAALSKVIGGLKPATQYQLEVRAFNSLAVSEFSAVSTGSTKASKPSEIYSRAFTLSSTSINVSWSPPANPNGFIVGYSIFQVEASRTIGMYEDWVDNVVRLVGNTTDVLSFVHTELDPYTTYTYSVAANSSAGLSSRLHNSNARTFEDVPVQMSNSPQITDIGTRQATVTWSKPKQPNGEITKFEIHGQQSENESPIFSGIPEENVDGKLWLILGNLKPDTDYKFTITTFTSKGGSKKSPENSASTRSQSASAKIATLVTVLSIFVVILSLGFMWEHRLRRVTVEIEPIMHGSDNFSRRVDKDGGSGMGMGVRISGVNGGGIVAGPGQFALQQSGNGYGQQARGTVLDPFAGLLFDQGQQRPGSPDSVSSASSASSASDSEA